MYRVGVCISTVLICNGFVLAMAYPVHAGTNMWTSNGPEPTGIFALAIDPSTPNTLYAGTRAGVFKSTDAAATWMPTNNGLPDADITIAALAVDPSTPGTLYAGGASVFKSTDAGNSWTAPSTASLAGVQGLAIDPKTPSTLYAGTQGGGVFKSTDGGITWTPANTGLTDMYVDAFAIDPNTPSTLYAGTQGGGVFKSIDSAASWTAVNTGLTDMSVGTLAIDPSAADTLYAGTFGQFLPRRPGHVFKSADGGANWTAVTTGGGFAGVVSIVIDPTHPSTLYAGTTGGGVLKSIDAGDSWHGASLPSGAIDALIIDPSTASTLYAGASGVGVGLAVQGGGAVFKSTDAGGSWNTTNTGLNTGTGLNTVASGGGSVHSLAIGRSTRSILYAGGGDFAPVHQGGGPLFTSADAGGTWTVAVNGPGKVAALAVDPTAPSTIYAGIAGSGVGGGGAMKSTDGGKNWAVIDAGLLEPDIDALVIDPTNPSTLYAASFNGDNVYTSTDAGNSWTTPSSASPGGVQALAIDPSAPRTVYAGNFDGVFKSTDAGVTWTLVNNGLTSGNIVMIVIDPNTPSTLYAGASSGGRGSTEGGVFKSTDAGASWTALNPGWFQSPFYALAIDPGNSNTLYVGVGPNGLLEGGVFQSTDGGHTWTAMDAGLPDGPIYALAFDPNTPDRLYAATDLGVFDLELVGATACAGDCDANSSVTADEVITLVNLALGTASAAACSHGIPGAERADVTLIIKAINFARNQCPAASVTAL